MTEDQIESILQVRRKRAELFGAGLFSDPAWDILLELFAAELGKRKIGLADLAPIAPRSTLARWLAKLEEMSLVVCDVDPLQPEHFWVALSRDCLAKISAFRSAAPHLARFQ